MTVAPYLIKKLQMQGFRAYLKAQSFDFSKKNCLAIFAPNGYGKSSIIDAVEFIFSKEGTLDRLGIRAIHNQAGPLALAHNLADDQNITPCVSINFSKGKEELDGVRDAGLGKRIQPAAATTVGACFTVSPIIRGHDLRRFVEKHTPEERYTDIATWLQLGPLVEVQKNLRTLRTQIGAATKDTSVVNRINLQLSKETANAVMSWDVAKVLAHVNTVVVAPLDQNLQLAEMENTDPAFVILSDRTKEEEQQIGLAGLRQIRESAISLYKVEKDAETGDNLIVGAIPIFEAAIIKVSSAAANVAVEHDKAKNAVFSTLWKAAEPLFAEGAAVLNTCPVCATPLDESKAGNALGVRNHLAGHLGELAEYAKAKKAFDEAMMTMTRERSRLVAMLPTLPKLLGDGYEALRMSNSAYLAAVDAWTEGAPPPSGDLTSHIDMLLSDFDKRIADIEAQQGEHTYAKAKVKIERLLEIKQEHTLAKRTGAELNALSLALTTQATFIVAEIRKKVQALLDTLQTPTNDIYRLIQGDEVGQIRLELPPDEEANQQRLNLVIDFAKNRTGVQPAGYLSDSQIHSVALAFRLAAIKCFNSAAPIVALDDIVTSYDADHRRMISSVIASELDHCQVIIATHDERFFNYLKDQLSQDSWQFKRILKLDPKFGPRFADHKVTDDVIQARWNNGESAANEMRQAEEEWLLMTCRNLSASVRIRTLEKAYSYERSELADALAGILNDAKLEPQLVAGVKNRFLSSLQQGLIENFGSHFQDGLYGDGSIGDEKARWAEFKAFQSQFTCPKCHGTSLKRPAGLKKPICSKQGCEAQFEFKAPPPVAPVGVE